MLTFFSNPRSYTGEDSVEIFSHASPYVVKNILAALSSLGMRQANPEEYSYRAF